MKNRWLAVAILSSAVAAGCSDRGNQDTRNVDETAPAATVNGERSGQATPDTTTANRDTREARETDRDAVSPDANDSADRRAAEGARPPVGMRQPNANGTAAGSRREDARSSTTAPMARRDDAELETGRNTDTRANPNVDLGARTTNNTTARANTPAPAARSVVRAVTVPDGTALPLELLTPLSSRTSQVETPVRARLRQAVLVDGVTALPAGAVFTGSVTEVRDAGRVQGRASLTFRFDEVTVRGARERVQTAPLSFQGEGTRGEDATKIGAGAVGGAIIGGILGGGDGAAKGAAIGGAAGTGVVLATKGKDVELAAGTDLGAVLADGLKVEVPAR